MTQAEVTWTIISIVLPFTIPIGISIWQLVDIIKSIKRDKFKEKLMESDEFKERQELEFLVKNHKIISLSYSDFNSFLRSELTNAIDAYIKFHTPQEITAEVYVNIIQYCIKEIMSVFSEREIKAIDSLYYKGYVAKYIKKICEIMIRSGSMAEAIGMNKADTNQGEK